MTSKNQKIIFVKSEPAFGPYQKLPGVRVSSKAHMRIFEISKMTGTTMSEVIRKIIEDGLELTEVVEEEGK